MRDCFEMAAGFECELASAAQLRVAADELRAYARTSQLNARTLCRLAAVTRDPDEKPQAEASSKGLTGAPMPRGTLGRILFTATVALGAWWISSAALGNLGGPVPLGIALVCLATGAVTGPRGIATAALTLLASLPWLIVHNHARLVAMQEDVRDHRWTAATLDGSLGMLRIGLTAFFRAWLALVFVHVAFTAATALRARVRGRKT